jgi:hypothetical protein
MGSGLGLFSASASSAVAAPSPLREFVRTMSVLKSGAVKRWLGERAIEQPTKFVPWRWGKHWRPPEMSRRQQALLAKKAIRSGEIKLEPTVMVPPPKFKGHAREHRREPRLAEVAGKMAEMPKLIAEYRQARLEKRVKLKAANRWK